MEGLLATFETILNNRTHNPIFFVGVLEKPIDVRIRAGIASANLLDDAPVSLMRASSRESLTEVSCF
jgi:hypothetical protein